MYMRIADVAARVSGAAAGLGGATASALAAKGATVFGLDLPQAIEQAPEVDGVTYVAADVTNPEQVAAAVEQASSGDKPLRITVNCAGIGTAGRVLSKKGPHDLDLYRKIIEVNLI